MEITLAVKTKTSEYQVDITAGTLIGCERQFHKPITEMMNNVSIEVLAWLAWDQTRRNGDTVPTFERWVDELIDIKAGDQKNPLAEMIS